MRNITYIKAALFAVCASAGFAEMPEPGCYERVYSAQHLKAHPEQVVSAIRMRVFDQANERLVNMEVLFANQGHVKRAGLGEQVLTQQLFCQSSNREGGRDFCAVDCDGGAFEVVRQDADGIAIRTEYLTIGDTESGCGGAINMAEKPDQPVTYVLNHAGPKLCGGM